MNGPHLWTFKCFLSEGGKNVIAEWYEAQSATVRAAFDTALEYLRDQPPKNWVRPFVGTLRGECAGLVEIRFTEDRVRHRPIRFYGPQRMEFTLLTCAVEKNRKFVPPSTCKVALDRKEIVISQPERAAEYDF